MTRRDNDHDDPDLDLRLERVVAAPVERLWTAWTSPDHLTKWFAPLPYITTECEVELRPGGVFRTVMRAPTGGRSTSAGCYLEIVENTRLVWTTVLGHAFRPARRSPGRPMTVVISFEPDGARTRYSLLAMHGDPAARQRHLDQGFREGWGAALDQLEALLA